jgi:sucrose-6F-phosphate phosphohydrolase
MLVSDIDGTLLEDGKPSAGLATLRILLAHHRDVRLVYATGRSYASTRALVRSGVLPAPEAIAAFVGTEVWLFPWERPEPSFARNLVGGWNKEAVLEAAADFPELRFQPEAYQTPFKVSFFLDDPEVVSRLAGAISSRGVRARIIYSSDRDLDILPRRAGKRRAVEYLRRLWGVSQERVLTCGDSGNDLSQERVLTCGDSGNDLDMLTDPAFQSVAVGNSEDEIQNLPTVGSLYTAHLPHAAGVLEGAEVYGFWPDDDAPRSRPEVSSIDSSSTAPRPRARAVTGRAPAAGRAGASPRRAG